MIIKCSSSVSGGISTSKADLPACVYDCGVLTGEAKWGFVSTKAAQTWLHGSLGVLVDAELEDALRDFAKMVFTDPS